MDESNDNPYAPPRDASAADRAPPASKIERARQRLRLPTTIIITLAIVQLVIDFNVVVLLLFATHIDGPPWQLVALGAISPFHVLQVVGARKIRNLTSATWGWGIAVTCVIPYASPLGFVGIPMGIGLLYLLSSPEIQQAFRQAAESRAIEPRSAIE